jgi:archaetidylinositol phosphate synthase
MKTQTGFQDAERTQTSLLTPMEKKFLIWAAKRMPPWINSDHLTILGFLGMLFAGLSYWWSRYNPAALWLVVFCLGVNWFGDSLDGTLARVRNRLRPRYGFYVDHVVDIFGILFLLGGLALSGYMSGHVALGLMVVYFMLSIEIYLAAYTVGVFKLSFWKWGPTELRILLSIGTLYLLYRPVVTVLGRRFLLFDVGGMIGIAVLLLMLISSAIRNTKRLYQEERLS